MMLPSTRRTLGLIGIAYCAGALTVVWIDARRAWHVAQPILSEDQPAPVEAAASAATPNAQGGEVRPAPAPPHEEPSTAPTTGESHAIQELRERRLLIPVDGVTRDDLRQSFHESRNGRSHEALDVLAPRYTPVRAVDDGRIARLFTSDRGGLTIYQFDSEERYCYYYAHLEQYAAGLQQDQVVRQGQVIGYVGTSGNAPPDTPHLHFAIFALGPEKRWWEGTPLDPYLALR